MDERKILFRGKSRECGRWEYGGLIRIHGAPCILDEIVGDPTEELMYWVPVAPETVGQYTGLTDKNGNKIFEGDIVRHYIEANMKYGNPDAYEVGLIRWNEKFLLWERTTPRPKLFLNDFVRLGYDCVYEVIGNIHDNPELWEGHHG